jgi:TonB family protein
MRSAPSLLLICLCLALAAAGTAAAAPAPAPGKAKPAVPPGEPSITAPGPGGDYLRMLHDRVHSRWTEGFIRLAQTRLPPKNPLNDRTRTVLLAVVIGADGQIISARVQRASGWLGFDDAAIEVVRDSAPLPSPPLDLRSDDGYVYIDWLFARDHRGDGVLTLRKQEQPLDTGLPQLVRAGRRDEAARRVARARARGGPLEPLMSSLAHEWLRASLSSPYAQVPVAAALAARNDRAGVAWLRRAVTQLDLAEAAGAALSARGERVCPLVKAGLGATDLSTQTKAVLALRDAGEPDCRAPLLALARGRGSASVRGAAIRALGAYGDGEAAAVLADAAASDHAPTRLVAAQALGHAGPGAAARVVALSRLLVDTNVDVRAAAAAAQLRAGGDAAAATLAPALVADAEPNPAIAAAAEMERMTGPHTAAALVQVLDRPESEARAAALRALVLRGERSSFAALAPFAAPTAAPALRGWGLVAADPGALASLSADRGLGPAVYRAYLARGERERAADWLLGRIGSFPPSEQDTLMLDWFAMRSPATTPTPSAASGPTTTAASGGAGTAAGAASKTVP